MAMDRNRDKRIGDVSGGRFESLMAAIQGGANSVHFGVGKLNMRAKSSVNLAFRI